MSKKTKEIDKLILKRIEDLERIVENQNKKIYKIKNELELKNFKENCNGKKYIVRLEPYYDYQIENCENYCCSRTHILKHRAVIQFINSLNEVSKTYLDLPLKNFKTEAKDLFDMTSAVKINGNYLEVLITKDELDNINAKYTIFKVYSIVNNQLTNIDLELYKKAFPDRFLIED